MKLGYNPLVPVYGTRNKRTIFSSVKKAAVIIAACVTAVFSAYKADAEPAERPAVIEAERIEDVGTDESSDVRDKLAKLRRIKEMLENANKRDWTTLSKTEARNLFSTLRDMGHTIRRYRPVPDTRAAFGYAPSPEDLRREKDARGPGDVYLGPRTIKHGLEWASVGLDVLEAEYTKMRSAIGTEARSRALRALQQRADDLSSRIAQLESELASRERELAEIKRQRIPQPAPVLITEPFFGFENLRPGHSTDTGFFRSDAHVLLHFSGLDLDHRPKNALFRTAENPGVFQAVQAKTWEVEAALNLIGPLFLSGGYTGLSHSSRFQSSTSGMPGEILGKRDGHIGYGGLRVLVPLGRQHASILTEADLGIRSAAQQVGLISNGRTVGNILEGRGNEGIFYGGRLGVFWPKRLSLLGQLSNDPFVPSGAKLALDLTEVRLPWTNRGLDITAVFERSAFVAQRSAGAGTVAVGYRHAVSITTYLPLVTVDLLSISPVFNAGWNALDYSGGEARKPIISYGGSISFGQFELTVTVDTDSRYSFWISGGAAPKRGSTFGLDGKGTFDIVPGENRAWMQGNTTVTIFRQ